MEKIIRSSCLLLLLFLLTHCSDEEKTNSIPFLIFKHGAEFTADNTRVPVGGQLCFGITAAGGGAVITDFRVKRITESGTITELDNGMYIESGGLDTTLVYVKGDADEETWTFFIMNENRDTASISMTVLKGDGSAYGPIDFYSFITIGFASNEQLPHFLCLHSGVTYSTANVAGNEQSVDIAGYYYISSGKSSPTLTCPAYPSAITYYPEFQNWAVRNSTLYDYKTTDNNLISIEEFDAAENDSLLVSGYKPQNVSGSCKFCYTGKVIPFKTSNGKYGLIKVIRADETETGSMDIAVKIQK